jgi:hypothetical protein
MSEETKITLSPKELELVCDTEWILTKHTIINKVYAMFGTLVTPMKQAMTIANVSADLKDSSPKISRGENYRQLPYVILDYPRMFGKADTVAIRTMFWWGNFFSVTLQLAGKYKQSAVPILLEKFDQIQQRGYWVCIHPDPWQHHFEEDNYVHVSTLGKPEFANIIDRGSFLKLAIKCPLSRWAEVPEFIKECFEEMIEVIGINYQADETSLSPGIPTTDFDL